MPVFSHSEAKPGQGLLDAGFAAFALAMAVFIALSLLVPDRARDGVAFLMLLVPVLLLGGLGFVMALLFFYAYVSGAPSVSLIAGFSPLAKSWRGISGVALLMGALIALTYMLLHAVAA